MKVPVSWLRDFVDVPNDPRVVGPKLGACGFAVESIEGDVIDFDVTANRPDCLSVYGLAREAATAFEIRLHPMTAPAAAPTPGASPVKLSVGDPGCPRYALAVVDVNVGPSPAWLAARLNAAGVRPINNIVDVTNYVMLELGHPMHAFDVAKLAGPEIHVRRAAKAESLVTIDGVTRTLDDTMLVIADRDRPIAVAGVMGGQSSEVSSTTKRIALESAWFLPSSVRATSKKLGLKTEASARFERGADLAAPVVAINRALTLLKTIDAGALVGGVTDLSSRAPQARALTLRRDRLARLLGDAIPDADVVRILSSLGFEPTAQAEGWQVKVPTFRVDVLREADLIEEVGRHWGFDRVPATFPVLKRVPPASDATVAGGKLIRRLLCGAGIQEAVTFTFMEEAAALPFGASDDIVRIQNPLSEKFAVLRPSIVPTLLESLTYNQHRQASDVRLFEVGATFSATRREDLCVGWVISGSRGPHWSGSAGPLQFSDTKGIATLLVDALGLSMDTTDADDCPWLVRGQRAGVVVGGRRVGWIGKLATDRHAADEVFVGELSLSGIGIGAGHVPHAITQLARHPFVIRDLSIVVDDRLPAADVRGTIRSNASGTLVAVEEFDRYQGKGVPEGRISLSIRLMFRNPDRTLTDAEVQHDVDRIVSALARDHGATLRGK